MPTTELTEYSLTIATPRGKETVTFSCVDTSARHVYSEALALARERNGRIQHLCIINERKSK